jgi:cytochrome c peroxidase
VTPDKALLGMALFWEEQLSSTDTVACGTCHGFARGGADSRPLPGAAPGPDGIFGTADDIRGSRGVELRDGSGRLLPSAHGFGPQVTSRKAPSVVNAAYFNQLFYDGRAASGLYRDPLTNAVAASGPVALENLVLGPPVNSVEMSRPGRTWPQVASKIAASRPLAFADRLPYRLAGFVASRTYPQLFAQAFGTAEVTPTRIVFAIATYLRTLVADDSRFDRALRGTGTLSVEEQLGRQLFENPQGSAAACVQCHSDVSPQSHTIGPASQTTTFYYGGTQIIPSTSFHNVGLRPVVEDPGINGGRFKTPLLRNVALHGRYGHNGCMGTLDDVVAFYDRGGDFHVGQATGIRPRNLSAAEQAALVAFLRALTDTRLQSGLEPFDRPRLGSERGGVAPLVFGVASAGTGGMLPAMVAPEPILVGKGRYPLTVADVRPGAPVFLMWDLATIREGVSVFGPRIYMGFLQFSLVGSGVAATGPDGRGYRSIAFDVPSNPRLAGTNVYAQWLVLDPEGSNGAAASAPVEFTLR